MSEAQGRRGRRHPAVTFKTAVLAAAVALVSATHHDLHAFASAPKQIEALLPKRADFEGLYAPTEVKAIADWAIDSRDNEGLPFLIVDKARATVYVFSGEAMLIGSAPALLGAGIGDTFAPGVAEMDMEKTQRWQRITPAGRFRAQQYRKPNGEWILWVDYNASIALHKVRTVDPAEHRHERLEATDPGQRRITYGCINVPVRFYDEAIHATFLASEGIVYVLPETRPAQALFGAYDVPQWRPAHTPHALEAPAAGASGRHGAHVRPLTPLDRSRAVFAAVIAHSLRLFERTLERVQRVTVS